MAISVPDERCAGVTICRAPIESNLHNEEVARVILAFAGRSVRRASAHEARYIGSLLVADVTGHPRTVPQLARVDAERSVRRAADGRVFARGASAQPDGGGVRSPRGSARRAPDGR